MMFSRLGRETRHSKSKSSTKIVAITGIILIILLITNAVAFLRRYRMETEDDYIFRIAKGRGIDITPLRREPTLTPNVKHLRRSLKGGVSSDVPLCSDLGVEVLRKGGFAADAAVTVALCLGLVNSFNSGMGGGGYIVSKRKDEEPVSIDAREMAPSHSEQNMFKGKEHLSKVGGLAAAIPGEVKGLYTIFDSQGSGNLTWAEVIQPVIDLAKSGWKASAVLASCVEADRHFLKDHYDEWSYLFKENSTEELISEGDLVRSPEIAYTLELLAHNGSDAIFYDPEGPIAGNLIDAANRQGGIFTKKDFTEYHVDVYSGALRTTFLGNDVYTCQGSCSGPALVSGLNILNHFGEKEGGDMDPITTQRLIETMKWVYSARSRLGEPSNNETAHITSKEWADDARALINDSQTLPDWKDYKPLYELNEPHGTTHFSIVDQHHNAIAMTSTINLLFGSLVRDPVTGIVLNNQMDDFSTPGASNAFGVEPSKFNFIRPGKRPLSSTVPTIIVNELGIPDLIIGAAGGSRILTAVLQAIVRIYSYHMPLLETLAYPRLHHQLLPNIIEHEDHIGSDILGSLEEKGHKTLLQPPKTALNAIQRWEGEWFAVSDYWRKRGGSSVL